MSEAFFDCKMVSEEVPEFFMVSSNLAGTLTPLLNSICDAIPVFDFPPTRPQEHANKT